MLNIVFWIAVLGLFQTYVFFPIILSILAKGKKQNEEIYALNNINDLPKVSILLAAYNEELVIEEKIKSTFDTSYPLDKIEFWIGSDASSDRTEEIIKEYQQKYPQLKLNVFEGRTGKIGIINKLAEFAKGEVFIMTDANVFFDKETIYQLVKHYKNEEIHLVGGNILNQALKKDGISHQEKTYLQRENIMKYQEGILWGSMMGAFGGVYSMRSASFVTVPKGFIVDDFFLTFVVLEKGKKAINELEAICYEDVSNKASEEFRRKVRISIGNFQNLGRFKKTLFPFYKGLGFSFLSHKVLRWLGPFCILLAIISSGILAYYQTSLYGYLLYAQLILMSIPIWDTLLQKLKIHIFGFRFISHFYLMNLALLVGFFKYMKGVENNIWTPTQRFQ
ncbi:MAG: glycosyltransferase [Cytophagales bacterium]|nr:glycosyltransferase [Cytophagales bacterium]